MRTTIYANAEHRVELENEHATPNSGRPLLVITLLDDGSEQVFTDSDTVPGGMSGAEAKAFYENLARQENWKDPSEADNSPTSDAPIAVDEEPISEEQQTGIIVGDFLSSDIVARAHREQEAIRIFHAKKGR